MSDKKFLELKVGVKLRMEVKEEYYPGEQFRYPNGAFNYDAVVAFEIESAKEDPEGFLGNVDWNGEFTGEVVTEDVGPDPEHPHGDPS